MSQAAWNLCPQKTQYDSDCYFEQDRGFDAISGAVHITLPDVPDGTWALAIKRDLMGKVRGAVRSSDGVKRGGVWFKVQIGDHAGMAGRVLLQSGVKAEA